MFSTSAMTFSANNLYYSKDKIEYTNKESLKLSGSITSVSVSPSVLNLSISTSLTIIWSSSGVNFVEMYLFKGGSKVAGPWGPYSSSPDGSHSTVKNLGGYQSGTDYQIKVQEQGVSSVFALSGNFEITKYEAPTPPPPPECVDDSECGECEKCEGNECESECGTCETCENDTCKVTTDIETILIIVPLIGAISIPIAIIHRKFKTFKN